MSLSRFAGAVIVASEHDPVMIVALRMRDARVGCVVVIRDGRPIGMLTDRDLALRVLAEGRDPASLGCEVAALAEGIADNNDASETR